MTNPWTTPSSASLMGANFTDYLREAHRALKIYGFIHIEAKKMDRPPACGSENSKPNG